MIRQEVIYGMHPVLMLLSAGRRRAHRLFYSGSREKERIKRVVEKAEALRIPVEEVDSRMLARIAKTDKHQGIAVKADPYPLFELKESLERIKNEGSSILIMDGIVDPRNFGAILRSAFCFGFFEIIIPKDRSASPSPVVAKASAGCLEHIFITRVANLVRAVEAVKNAGYWIYGLDSHAKTCLGDEDPAPVAAVIVGGEEKGIRPLLKRHCDFLLSIPHHFRCDSLNAAVAASIMMYETSKRSA